MCLLIQNYTRLYKVINPSRYRRNISTLHTQFIFFDFIEINAAIWRIIYKIYISTHIFYGGMNCIHFNKLNSKY